jgi:hypothetical protein
VTADEVTDVFLRFAGSLLNPAEDFILLALLECEVVIG